jgi:hypothetical protein
MLRTLWSDPVAEVMGFVGDFDCKGMSLQHCGRMLQAAWGRDAAQEDTAKYGRKQLLRVTISRCKGSFHD